MLFNQSNKGLLIWANVHSKSSKSLYKYWNIDINDFTFLSNNLLTFQGEDNLVYEVGGDFNFGPEGVIWKFSTINPDRISVADKDDLTYLDIEADDIRSIKGEEFADMISEGRFADYLYKNSTIIAEGGKKFYGSIHDDTIISGQVRKVFGKDGNDFLITPSSSQSSGTKVVGGAGDDVLIAYYNARKTKLVGGAGNDTFNIYWYLRDSRLKRKVSILDAHKGDVINFLDFNSLSVLKTSKGWEIYEALDNKPFLFIKGHEVNLVDTGGVGDYSFS